MTHKLPGDQARRRGRSGFAQMAWPSLDKLREEPAIEAARRSREQTTNPPPPQSQ